jgi:hypothetical protein
LSPLTPEQRAAYGEDWPAVSRAVRDRAGGRCECAGECGWVRHDYADRCEAMNHEPSPFTGSRVVLTVAHLDRDGHTGTNDPDRLKAMCQGCHLAYDRQAR